MAIDLKKCGELTCEQAQNFDMEALFKMLLTDDGNGCIALKTKAVSGGGSGGGGTTTRTPSISVATVAGNTPTGCVAFTILFQGAGGTLGGQTMPDGASISYGNGTDPITAALAYVPPASGSVIISKLV